MIARALLVISLSLLACRAHPEAAVEVLQEDCASCHMADYLAASNPVHVDRMPDTCADCHTIEAWRPAVGFGHPEAFFPIARGDHEGIQCLECHEPERGPDAAGANTDCIGCHTGAHEQAEMDEAHGGVADYRFEPSEPNFCLSCHPDGQAADHPDSEFPLSGPHGGITCGDCHDASLGPSTDGQNANCIGCHTGEHSMSRMNEAHQEEGDYSWQPDMPAFCRQCHPRGLKEDD